MAIPHCAPQRLSSHICKDPVSKYIHLLRLQVDVNFWTLFHPLQGTTREVKLVPPAAQVGSERGPAQSRECS